MELRRLNGPGLSLTNQVLDTESQVILSIQDFSESFS
jgi:hypothetical protein